MEKYKWYINNYKHLKVDKKGVIFNTKTGRKKKLCVNNYSRGIWVTNKIFLVNPNKHLVLIPRKEIVYCPFSNGTIKI